MGARGALGRYLLLVGSVVGLAAVGYIGYVFYPRFDLPALTGASLLLLAAAAGVAALFSPCSFPLLLTLLARQEGGREQGSVLRAAAALAFGAAAFLALLGLLISLGAAGLFGRITFTSLAGRVIRSAVGALLVLLGLVQSEILPLTFHPLGEPGRVFLRLQAELRRDRPTAAFAVYGFGYLLAGFG